MENGNYLLPSTAQYTPLFLLEVSVNMGSLSSEEAVMDESPKQKNSPTPPTDQIALWNRVSFAP